MDLYCYVIATDCGAAPNYELPFVTLAICKPRIRKRAKVGDVVLAYTGGKVSREQHAVRWAGVVSERLTFAQYWKDPRFAPKRPESSKTPDNIYRPSPEDAGLIQVANPVHVDRDIERDLSGINVLVFDRAWRFSGAKPVMPQKQGFRMQHGRRNHRRHILDGKQWGVLEAWLEAQKTVKVNAVATARNRSCAPQLLRQQEFLRHPKRLSC